MTMETLKAFDEIQNPDPRYEILRFHDLTLGTIRDLALSDLYREAAEIALIDSVPEAVQSHFAQARNLLVYAWFHYQFGATAEFMALVTLEMALRKRFDATSNMNLKVLLEKAANAGGPRAQRLIARSSAATIGSARKANDENAEPKESEFSPDLATLIRKVRNEFAHGSNSITTEPAKMVRYCADLINEMFALKSEA